MSWRLLVQKGRPPGRMHRCIGLSMFRHARPCSTSAFSKGKSAARERLANAPSLKEFLSAQHGIQAPVTVPASESTGKRRVFVETYGCQMNVSDSEIVQSILAGAGYELAPSIESAHTVLINTCAIREGAEQKVWHRLTKLKHRKQSKGSSLAVVGVLGCMAERLKSRLLESDKLVDIVVGPDAYRDLPRLLSVIDDGAEETAMNVQLSLEETYADITPVRTSTNNISAFVSIARGCDNMCSYCIVPFTRGRERSRPVGTIVEEVQKLSDQGFKEVVLLGQNVNSYQDFSRPPLFAADPLPIEGSDVTLSEGFTRMAKQKPGGVRFAELVDAVASVNPEMRIRFTSPHPQHFPDSILSVLRDRDNVCSQIHLPAQSGSTSVLRAMRRGYTQETYLNLVDHIRSVIPGVALSSDFISGFCGETEEDHQDTLSLLRRVQYDHLFMFAYSLRERTHAHRRLVDDVPEEVKQRRLREVIDLGQETMTAAAARSLDTMQLVLIEGPSRRSEAELVGRADNNHRVIIPDEVVSPDLTGSNPSVRLSPGDYVAVRINRTGSRTSFGTPIGRTTLQDFFRKYKLA